jgi:hypothetical protein
MNKLTLAAAILLAATITLAPAAAQESRPTQPTADQPADKRVTFDHRAFSALLERHVQGERVDYVGLLRDRAMLDMYTVKLAKTTPTEMKKWDRNERFAFWVNTYNAYTLKLILDHYKASNGDALDSINSIRIKGKGPWDAELVPMPAFHPDGKRMGLTLNQVENSILRPEFGDARVHAAVNCAAIGCPPLRAEAFVGERLEQQLAEQMQSFLGQKSRNAFDAKAKTIRLSSIFDWYAEDFQTRATGASPARDLRDYLIANGPEAAGATAKQRAWIREAKITFGEYDWALNDIERKRPKR